MKGYIYTMSSGYDAILGRHKHLNDPSFDKVPTLGACMPNIRRLVSRGDHIFVVSGSVDGVQQYVVGGFEVDEKINALTAFERFPENRLRYLDDGSLHGNIIVDEKGKHHQLDDHDKFEMRIENYIVGRNPLSLSKIDEIERARQESLPFLQKTFRTRGDTVFSVLGRWRRMNEHQVEEMNVWLRSMKE